MTIQERAKRIYKICFEYRPVSCIDEIESELQQAVRAAVDEACNECDHQKLAVLVNELAKANKARNEALEKAAQVAQAHECAIARFSETCRCDEEISESIRALKDSK